MGMQRHALHLRALHVIEKLRLHLPDTGFASRHRKRPADFTRQRVLTFPVLMLLLLQKSLKSLQAHGHEFFWQWRGPAVSAGALTHARDKLCASAFVELNALVLQTVYQDSAHAPLVQRWRGHRLLGSDRFPGAPARSRQPAPRLWRGRVFQPSWGGGQLSRGARVGAG